MEEENKKNFLIMEQMSKEIEEKTAEAEAANIIAVQLQVKINLKCKHFFLQVFHLTLFFF